MKSKTALLIFACAYGWLYMFPEPYGELPGIDWLTQFYQNGFDALALWFGKNLLQIQDLKKIEFTGSGDTTLDFVKIPLRLLLAVLATAVIVRIFSKEFAKTGGWLARFFAWTRAYARWYLGFYMIIYGVAKVVEGGQFSAPDLPDLLQPLGEMSPMGLLWRFMGFSHGYAAFTGFLEIFAGLLLLFRQTTMLGALLTIGVMSNVFMMNMCFDVPVKLFSFHLILIAAALLVPDFQRLAQFFFLEKATAEPAPELELLPRRWMRSTKNVAKGIVIAGVVIGTVYLTWSGNTPDDQTALRGVYEVDKFVVNNQELPMRHQDSVRWNRAVIEGRTISLITSDKRKTYQFQPDKLLRTAIFRSFRDSTQSYSFQLEMDSNILKVNGLWRGDSLQAVMRRVDESKFLLTSRGFHWVNEYPFNR